MDTRPVRLVRSIPAQLAAVALLAARPAAASHYAFEAQLRGSDTVPGDQFGNGLAISGDVAVVGAPGADTAAGIDAGAAYVFVRAGSTWAEAQKLAAPDGAPYRSFGFSVALEGDTLVVGAPTTLSYSEGAAYVYVRSGASWLLQQKLVPAPGSLQAGYSVSLDGDTVAVGAPGDAFHNGQAFVFVRSGTTWTQQYPPPTRSRILPLFPDSYGRSISIFGDTMLVGLRLGILDDAAVPVFLRSGSAWTPQQYLHAPPQALPEIFGESVSVSGDTAGIGTLYDSLGSGNQAFVFVRSGGVWALQQTVTSTDVQPGDDFGSVVLVVGDTLVVGAPITPFGGTGAGAGYVFTRSGAAWMQQQRFSDPNGVDGDRFAAALALSGESLAFGAPGGDVVTVLRGIHADLGVSNDDGQAAAVPGEEVTSAVVVSNAGPDDATASVSQVSSPALLGVSWTCSASPGSSCSPSGTGALADNVSLLAGGAATYLLTGTVDPAATGTLVSTAEVTGAPGLDANPANDSATDTDALTPVADLALAKTDGQTAAVPGLPVTYTITVANTGPSVAAGAVVADAVPPTLQGAVWTCSASSGSSCAAGGSGGINDAVTALVGGTLTYSLTGTLDPAATVSLVNTASVAPAPGASDPALGDNTATDVDALPFGLPIDGELVPGYDRQHDLAALPGPAADEDLFRIYQQPHASYEVLLDGASADLGSGFGPFLERVASDAATVLQLSSPAGAGGSRSLRWMNAQGLAAADQLVRVRSAGCTTDCDPGDVYRLRARETTGLVPRFNNSGTQVTVLVLENAGDEALDVDVRFWSQTGGSLGGSLATLGPHSSQVLDTSASAPAASGSITVASTGRYGQLTGKAVALEPATGFAFDTALELRQR